MNNILSIGIIEEYYNIAIYRSSLYQYFSLAFRYPNNDIITVLKKEQNILLDGMKYLYHLTSDMDKTLNMFKKTINSIIDIQELQVEYARLFVGPFKLPAPPYESVYRIESKGFLMGDSTLKVKKMYQEEGLDLPKSTYILPDHIVVELEFMAYLAEEEALTWEKMSEDKAKYYLKKQNTFLTEHLTKWIPQFAKAVYENSNEEFYCLLAKITDDFIALDNEFVKTLIEFLD